MATLWPQRNSTIANGYNGDMMLFVVRPDAAHSYRAAHGVKKRLNREVSSYMMRVWWADEICCIFSWPSIRGTHTGGLYCEVVVVH
jgi:hypothetical protein